MAHGNVLDGEEIPMVSVKTRMTMLGSDKGWWLDEGYFSIGIESTQEITVIARMFEFLIILETHALAKRPEHRPTSLVSGHVLIVNLSELY